MNNDTHKIKTGDTVTHENGTDYTVTTVKEMLGRIVLIGKAADGKEKAFFSTEITAVKAS